MCRTPAPRSTAAVARAIWSGVGEVNTAPGHAASSMPKPTKPPCIGSWPLPPPETIPTLPFLGASLRMITFGSYSTLIKSPWAAAIPARASLTSVSGVLISFFSRVVTAVSAIAASSYLPVVGYARRKKNMPMPFPISSPSAMAARLIASFPPSKWGANTASITAPIASPPPPISRMRFSRSARERGRARGAGEGFVPRSPWALPICRFSWREMLPSSECSRPLCRRRPRHGRSDRHGQVLVHDEVVNPGAERSADQRHQGRDPDVAVGSRHRVRAIPDDEHPEPRPEVAGRIQRRHLDRREKPDQRRNHAADRHGRHAGRRRDPVFDDPEARDHQDRRDDDLSAGTDPPGILLQSRGVMADQQRMRPVRGEDEPALDAVRAAPVDYRLGRVLVVVDQPVPDEGDAGRCKERPDDLGADVARQLRPGEPTPPGQGQCHRRVEMSARDRAAGVDREGDRKSPEKSRGQQPGQEAVLAARHRIRNEAVAEKNEDEDAEHLAHVLFSPAFFRYRHVSSSFDNVVHR